MTEAQDKAHKGAVVVFAEPGDVTAETQQRAAVFAAEGYHTVAAPWAEGAGVFAGLQALVDAAGEAGRVALVGYGAGGDLAYAAGNRLKGLACVVAQAGAGTLADFREKRKAPTLLCFVDGDAGEISQFRAHRPDVSTFTGDETTEARTLDFISQFVIGAPAALMKNAGAYAQAKVEKKKKKKDDGLGPPLD